MTTPSQSFSNETTDELHDRLIAALLRLRRRQRWRDGLRLLARWGWLVVMLAFLVQATSWFVPLERAMLWSGGVLLVAVIGWLAWVLLRPLPLKAVARRVDSEGRLKERLVTALEFSAGRGTPRSAGEDLVRRQLDDAVRVAERAARSPADVLQLVWPRRRIGVAALFLAGTLALALLPNPQRGVIAERRAVRELAAQEAEQIEQVRQALSDRETLPREERERLLQDLDELAARLRRNPGDREQALADLERAREALREQLDPQAGARRASLEQLSSRLSELSGQQSGRRSLADGAEALRELAQRVDRLSPQERAEAAAALREQAGRVAAGDPALADALSDMAAALEAGDAAAAEEAAARGDQALRAAAGELDDQQAIAQALGELEDSRERLAQAGQSGQSAQAQGQQQTEGAGQGQGQGQNPGQSQGGAQAGGGGGTNADRLPPDTRTGQFGGADPTESGDGAQTGAYEPDVFAPLSSQGNSDRDVVQGAQGGEGTDVERQRRDPGVGTGGDAVVPLRDALPTYRDAAAQALEQEYIPGGLRGYVRDYFTQLSSED